MQPSWRWLETLALLALLSLQSCEGRSAPATEAARPDILMVVADDQTYHDVGCYGNPDVSTPNIDRLAAEGMRFTRAFTATAMCAPSRQQLYTGVFPVRNGAYPNHSNVYPGTRSIVHHLRSMGYRVGLSGKAHFGPPGSFPFERVSRQDIREFVTRDETRPYCLIVASDNPHLPWEKGDPTRYHPDELALPPYVVDTKETRRAFTKYYAEITELDREVGEYMKVVRESGKPDNTIFIYTTEQGAQFPRGKWTCYDTGLQVALVVRWPDRVKSGSVTPAMVQYVDILPTLIEAAGGNPDAIDTGLPRADGGRGFDGRSFLEVLLGQTDRHHDVVYGVQTTRGIAHGSPSYPIRSIRTEQFKLIWNLQHDSEFSSIVLGNPGRSGYWPSWIEKARTDAKAARFVADYQRRPEFELYDVQKDPFELNNLASDPRHRRVRESMLKQLRKWMQQQGDEGIETELRAAERQAGSRRPEPESFGPDSGEDGS